MKEIDIFDSIFKEKLSSASLKAPESVWDNVSGRISAQHPSPRQHYAWWWSAAAGLCAAAAVFAVVLSGGAQKLENNEGIQQRIEILASEGKGARELAYMDGVFEMGAEELDNTLRFRALRETPKPVEESPEKEVSPKAPEEEVEIVELEWEDPFASMMAQEQSISKPKKQHKSSIILGGVVGANDSHQQGRSLAHPLWTSGYTYDGVNENSTSTYSIPLSLGISYKQAVTERFAVSLGLNWTLLNRYFNGSYNTVEGEVTHSLHYVGIPLNLYYDIVKTRNISIYAYGGVSVEKCVSSKYYIRSTSSIPLISEKVDELQFGLKVGVGGAFRVTDFLSIYFDPYLAYYIPGNQPKSLRTEYPAMISFEAGLRFNL